MQNRGFTLMEVLVAMALMSVAALGGLQLVAVATEMVARARVHSLAASLASTRMEQLRSLRFEFDAAGLRSADATTDLTVEPASSGGPGLTPSGGSALDQNIGGYVDFLGRNGAWLGTGGNAPPGTAFVRRWSIEPIDVNGDLLVVHVLVRPAAAGSAAGTARVAGEARFVSLRARTRR
jgi:prepilin-type N-terminal cleavage/methylation domain-containing protein